MSRPRHFRFRRKRRFLRRPSCRTTTADPAWTAVALRDGTAGHVIVIAVSRISSRGMRGRNRKWRQSDAVPCSSHNLAVMKVIGAAQTTPWRRKKKQFSFVCISFNTWQKLVIFSYIWSTSYELQFRACSSGMRQEFRVIMKLKL